MDFWYIILILLLLIVCIALVSASLACRGTDGDVARQAYTARAETIGRAAELAASVEQSRAYLDALGETTSDGVLLLDNNRQIVWGNAAAWEMFEARRCAGRPTLHRSGPRFRAEPGGRRCRIRQSTDHPAGRGGRTHPAHLGRADR